MPFSILAFKLSTLIIYYIFKRRQIVIKQIIIYYYKFSFCIKVISTILSKARRGSPLVKLKDVI